MQLKEDQEAAISKLLRTSREFEKMMNEKDVVSKEQVITQMMENWEMNKANDQHLAGKLQLCQVPSEFRLKCIFAILNYFPTRLMSDESDKN